MDRIIKSHLNKFAIEHSVENLPESQQFERFANFCVISKYYPTRFSVDLITTGDPECGIDGVAFIIDGELITTEEEAKSVFKRPKREMEVQILFVQAKSSEPFKRAEILKFSDAVEDFTKDTPNLPMDSTLTEAHRIFNCVLDNVGKVSNGKPSCHLFYVTTGNYNAEREIKSTFKNVEDMLEATDLFTKFSVRPIEKNSLIKLWTATWSEIEARLEVKGYLPFPEITGITEAYMVIMPAKTLVEKVLSDSEDNLRTYIFDENVRAFLGEDNPVNEQIAETIINDSSRDQFAILNNGITIISPDVRVQSNSVYIKNFQIVNGCQTSNVLYHHRDKLSDNVMITAKIIEVQDSDLVGEVIKATNSQTKVEEIQFFSLKPIVKNIEGYFESVGEEGDDDIKLYFERRDRQYVGLGIPEIRIFNLKEVSRAVASMFLERPDLAARYPTQMFQELHEKLFDEKNREIVYYTAALALYRLLLLIGNQRLPSNYGKYKWHLLLCLKHLITKKSNPDLNNHKIDAYCQEIVNVCKQLSDDSMQIFQNAASVITQVGEVDRDKLRTSLYIQELKKAIYS